MLVFHSCIFPYLYVDIPSLFMKEEDNPFFFWKVGAWFPNGREEGALFARQPFFLLDSQII